MNSLWFDISTCLSRLPEASALIDVSGRRMTYAELDQGISEVAEDMLNSVHEVTGVGLFSRKNHSVIVHLLAAIKSNVPYIPLDIDSPIDRLLMIVADSGINALVVEKEIAGEMVVEVQKMGFVCTHEIGEMEWWTKTSTKTFDDETAYILFTSGSTGRPKGVEITYSNAKAFVDWSSSTFKLDDQDVVSSIAPLHFDLSIFDIFSSLVSGSSILLFDQKSIKNPLFLVQRMQEEAVSIIYTTPTVLQLMIRYGKWHRKVYPELRMILFAGEPYPIEKWHQLASVWPDVEMYNLYGPTETNVVTFYKTESKTLESYPSIPIGTTCPYVEWRLSELEPTGQEGGQRGVLWISGDSVAKGYCGRAEETKQAFLTENGKVWYNTGDIVEVNAQGLMFYSGRIDRMTMKNGYRIELGEIESAARRIEDVEDAVAVAITESEQVKIKLYLTFHEGQLEEADVRNALMKSLPMYMMPDDYSVIANIPMTSNHKVDFSILMNQ